MDPLSEREDTAELGTLPERVLLSLAMISIAVLCAIVTLTVISRTFFRPIIPDDVLIVREVMVAAILLPLAMVTAQRAHISVTVFTDWTGERTKRLLEAIGHLFGVIFAALLCYAGWRLFIGAWTSGEYFDGDIYLPMWIGYATFVSAVFVFLIRLVVMVVVDFRRWMNLSTSTP